MRIPVLLIIPFFLGGVFGERLNLLWLGGMVVVIGLFMDDGFVVVKNIHRHLKWGENRETAVTVATDEILGAVAGSTFTTVVVFLPLGLVEGVVGQFFAAFSITLSIAVLVSLVVAFALIPLLAQKYLRPEKSKQDTRIETFTTRYEPLIRWALAHTNTVLLATGVLVIAGLFVYTRLGSGFLPIMDEGSFVLDY